MTSLVIKVVMTSLVIKVVTSFKNLEVSSILSARTIKNYQEGNNFEGHIGVINEVILSAQFLQNVRVFSSLTCISSRMSSRSPL